MRRRRCGIGGGGVGGRGRLFDALSHCRVGSASVFRIGWSLSEQDPGDGHFGWCSGYLEMHSVVYLHPVEYYATCCGSFELVLGRPHSDEMFEISGSASVSQGNFDTPR